MDKSIHTAEYTVIVALLKEAREAAGLSQVELAGKLKQSQSFVSKMETGDRRLDMVQLRTVCVALGTTLTEFVARFEERIAEQSRPTSNAQSVGRSVPSRWNRSWNRR